MTRIGDLLDRDLSQPIDELVRIDNDDQDTVFAELTEYVATDRIQLEFERLLRALATAKPGESAGASISGFFGSGKSLFAKNLGHVLANREIRGVQARALFLQRMQSQRIAETLDSFTQTRPYAVFPVHVPSGPAAEKVKLAELMNQALLRAARRPGQPAAFILDEVSDGDLEGLCETAREFDRTGIAGPIWIIVTAQQKPLSPLFRHHVDLSDAGVTEIARRRVLRKKEDQKPILRKLFQDFGPELIENARLEGSSRPTEFDQEQFVESYPYLPHFLDLSLDILAGLRLQPNAPKYVESNNRTLVKQCFEMLLAGRPARRSTRRGTRQHRPDLRPGGRQHALGEAKGDPRHPAALR